MTLPRAYHHYHRLLGQEALQWAKVLKKNEQKQYINTVYITYFFYFVSYPLVCMMVKTCVKR